MFHFILPRVCDKQHLLPEREKAYFFQTQQKVVICITRTFGKDDAIGHPKGDGNDPQHQDYFIRSVPAPELQKVPMPVAAVSLPVTII